MFPGMMLWNIVNGPANVYLQRQNGNMLVKAASKKGTDGV